ncbi:response regulator transcription factor [Flavobacterium sp. xlx-214]|uniref:response regulator n=1 Tax=unclassified Flavobacterium TaxID=196869 RepID=UPI0013D78077|nr:MULTISPECIES: response regulator [unclassified Flavobacterium]MBA5793462.1 response regulator transcription factor [Flavobacterium sp. xlx-221]QMI82766.1 response regulator transcription factor [Flavobacterium sp. xlx-214]
MNILLLDDHELIVEGYIAILDDTSNNFTKLYSCKQLYHTLLEGFKPDIAILDYNVPSYPEQNMYSGADCAVFIKEYVPRCKIILITAQEEATVLYKIYKKTNADALITKSDFKSEDLRNIVNEIIPTPYLSTRVLNALNEIRGKNSLLSVTNMEILMYLAQGFKVNQISDFVELSTPAIQKRVNKMLQEFEVADSQKLVLFCKQQNLL